MTISRRRVVWCGLVAGILIGFCLAWAIFSDWRAESLRRAADRELLVHQRPEVAEEIARKLLWYEPDHDQGLLILGVSLNWQKRFEESVPFLERVPSASKFRREAELSLASSLLNLGWYRRSETIAIKHLESNPDNSLMQELLIRIYRQTLRLPDVIRVHEAQLRGTAADEPTLRSLLDVLAGNVSPSAVIEMLEQCPRKRQEPDVLAALGRAAVLQGDLTSAADSFNLALELDPESLRIILWSSEFHASTGQMQLAESLLNRVDESVVSPSLQTQWNCAEYWRLRAVIDDHHDRLPAALEHCNSSLQYLIQPETLSLKAGLLRRMNRTDDASETSKQLATYGSLDFEILKLATELRAQPITLEHANRASMALEGLGYRRQAASWNVIADQLSGPGD